MEAHDHGPLDFHAPTRHSKLTTASWHIQVIYIYPLFPRESSVRATYMEPHLHHISHTPQYVYSCVYVILLLALAGFKETTKACCGAGGEYNVQEILCGTSGYVNGVLLETKACADPNSYFSWDGIHSTEAVARIMAESLLKGNYLEPSYALSNLCKLNFEKFQIG